MKITYFFILFFVLSLTAEAQDFIPLRIDSSYSFFRSFDFVGNPIEVASFAGYSYNLEDQLVQIRRENERSVFTYPGNQEIETVEIFADGVWTNERRITTTFAGDLPVRIKTEIYPDGAWENSRLDSISYTDSARIQVYLTQLWNNNSWVNQEQIENTYDAAANRTSQSYFNADINGDFIFNFGDRIVYNENNQPTEILGLTGNNGNIVFSDKFNFSYNNDQLPDTVIYCFYSAPDTVNCMDLSRSVFTYDSEEDRITRDIYSRDNEGEWISSGREETYTGRQIYSALPDSILTYDYSLPSDDQLITRQYYDYEELGEGKVVYRESLFLYDFTLGQSFLQNYREEYYSLRDFVASETLAPQTEFTLFPNPVGSQELITLRYEGVESNQTEVYIFTIAGQLLSRQKTGANQQFSAPDMPGIYFVKIKNEKGSAPMQKLIVQ